MTYIRVSIDLDDVIDELSTEDVARIVEKSSGSQSRVGAPDPLPALNELMVALKLGHVERALEIARRHVNDQLGTCL